MKTASRTKILSLALIFIVSVSSILSQTNAAGEARKLFVRVTVTDEKGNIVSNLKPENFKLFDDKKAQPIIDFQSIDEPASVGILLDRSGSMSKSYYNRDSKFDKQTLLRQGIRRFLSASNSENSYFLLAFAEKPEILVDETTDAAKISAEFEKLSSEKPTGWTSFYDALSLGIEKLSKSKYNKRVLLIFTDGDDNNSHQKFGAIKDVLKKSDVIVYIVNVYDNSYPLMNVSPNLLEAWAYLDEIAGFTGGRAFHVTDKKMVEPAFELLATELRTQYLLGFAANKSGDERSDWHDLKVKVELNPDAARKIGKVYARNRAGYSFHQ